MKVFIATKKQLLKKKVTFDELKVVLQKMGIRNQKELIDAIAKKSIVLPTYNILNKICKARTGKTFDEYCSVCRFTKEELIQDEFVNKLRKWCNDHKIKNQSDYTSLISLPEKHPSSSTIISLCGEEYFNDILFYKKQKNTYDEKLRNKDFVNKVIMWCVENKITSRDMYRKAKKPKGFPTYATIMDKYPDFFKDNGFKKQSEFFLSEEEALKICKEKGILTSIEYGDFKTFYNKTHQFKLDRYSKYKKNFRDFIGLSETQLFISKSMSSLERCLYKILFDYGIDFEMEKTFKDCRSKNPLPFDFYLPNIIEKPVIIELDGEQHNGSYNEKYLFHSKNTEKHDKIKDKYCKEKENEIEFIRIKYTDNILQILNEKLDFSTRFDKKNNLDWTKDFNTENDVLKSKLSKSLKVKILLMMVDQKKIILSNKEIIHKVGIKGPDFYKIKKELVKSYLLENKPKKNYITEEKKKDAIDFNKKGKSIAEISKETHLDARVIIKMFKKCNIKYKSRSDITTDAIDFRKKVAALHYKGVSNSDIAKKFKRLPRNISWMIKEIEYKRGNFNNLTPKEHENIKKIKFGLLEKKTITQIAKDMKVSKQYVSKYKPLAELL